MKKRIILSVAVVFVAGMSFAQLRPTNKDGINVFETEKTDTVSFNGLKVKIGGALALPYSMLTHSNSSSDLPYNATSTNTLYPLAKNFGLPQANLYIKSTLADGVNLNFEIYLASRHHNETWVKGGYLQFDKMPFLPWTFVDQIMQVTTLKVGQFDVNYGDAHFRRSDGGLTLYNPFMENYIMDEFATEIGAEADVHLGDFTLVGAITNGQLNPDLGKIDTTKTAYKYSNGKHNPSLIGKLAFDKQLGENLRVRVSGSAYYTAGAIKNTLFGGDRTGSNYYGVMYVAAPGTGTYANGRYNPGITDKLFATMGNLFLKYTPVSGVSVESFTTLEKVKGRSMTEKNERTANQFATDLVVRFGASENFFIGARLNTLKAEVAEVAAVAAKPAKPGVPVNPADLSKGWITLGTSAVPAQNAVPAYDADINRVAFSAGWFMTKNIMAKVEYVTQKYNGFPANSLYDQGKFSGLSAQAAIAF